jgi:MFS transporter, FHS family, L-fucose permease
LLTAIQGFVSTSAGDIRASYWVPLFCFAVVALYGLLTHNLEKPGHKQ